MRVQRPRGAPFHEIHPDPSKQLNSSCIAKEALLMKRVLASALVAGLAVLALSTDSNAGPNANAKIQLHLLSPTTKSQCTRLSATPVCNAVVVQGTLYPTLYYAYVLVTDGDATAGIAGLEFGITYNGNASQGVDIYGWTLCATLEFQQPSPVWPSSGGGNLITWDSTNRCQVFEPGGAGTGVVADAGYFYLGAYSPDVLAITPRPVSGFAKVATCAAEEDVVAPGPSPSHLGTAGFGGQPGYNPCGLNTPIQPTTWSNVKSIYSK
jgi:hypothetical protein